MLLYHLSEIMKSKKPPNPMHNPAPSISFSDPEKRRLESEAKINLKIMSVKYLLIFTCAGVVGV